MFIERELGGHVVEGEGRQETHHCIRRLDRHLGERVVFRDLGIRELVHTTPDTDQRSLAHKPRQRARTHAIGARVSCEENPRLARQLQRQFSLGLAYHVL